MTVERTVLVTDAERGSAVAVIRSLGRRGHRVIAAAANRASLGFRSRYAHHSVVYPDPREHAQAFLDALHRVVADHGVDLLIPISEEVMHPLAHDRERFEAACRLALADRRALQLVTDKTRTVELAREEGVPIPRTLVVASAGEARERAGSLPWPVVLKPAVSRLFCPRRGRSEAFAVSYAEDEDALVDAMRRFAGGTRVLLQEYCPGRGEGVELLSHEGRVLAAFQHRRLAEVPPWGGRSAWRESVPLEAELYAHASRLAKALRWTGLLMVEFKVAAAARLMEINGRVWGSLPLAEHAGMDFPGRLAELYFRGPPPPEEEPFTGYRVGVRSFDLYPTLSWIFQVLARRNPYPFLDIPRRREVLPVLLGLLSPWQRMDLTARDDLRPAIAEPLEVVRRARRKVGRALASRGARAPEGRAAENARGDGR